LLSLARHLSIASQHLDHRISFPSGVRQEVNPGLQGAVARDSVNVAQTLR
jgi:hypothetical protein